MADAEIISTLELEREKLWRDCAADGELRAHEHELCRRDVVHWVKWWVWTQDPRLDSGQKILPLDPFPRQVDFLRWLEERERTKTSGLVCKGRGTGITWLCVCFAMHRWLFEPAWAGTFASRREDLVDSLGDMSSILPKARYLLSRLPVWMMPRHFKMERDAGFMKLRNPGNGATVIGEHGDQIGRGGRASALILDEAAFIPRLAGVFAAAAETSDVQICVSTPGMPGDPFDQRCDRADIHEIFEIDWRQDPRKNQEWATAKRAEIGPMLFAKEYECNRKISMEGLVIQPQWVQAAQRLRGLVDLQPGGFVVCGGDVGGGGRGKSVLIARSGAYVYAPVSWTDPHGTAFRFSLEINKVGGKVLNYDTIGVGLSVSNDFKSLPAEDKAFTINGINVGQPPDKRKTWPDGKTSAEKFQNLRAELWWMLRDRLEKTHEHVLFLEGDHDQGREHPIDELLALPDDPALAAQLSHPTWYPTNAGKIQIESKVDMRSRGLASPDLADALTLSLLEASDAARPVLLVPPVSFVRARPFAELDSELW